jgi:hypothetical protein
MLIQLNPFTGNTKKRLIKSPKIYLSDTGITTALLNLRNFEQAAGHPVFGSLWESVILSNLYGHFPDLDYSFYRTSHGAEIDLVVSNGSTKIAIECKASVSPTLSVGTYNAIDDINPEMLFVAAPVDSGYPMKKGVEVVSLTELIKRIRDMMNA